MADTTSPDPLDRLQPAAPQTGESWRRPLRKVLGWFGLGPRPAREGSKAYRAGDYDAALRNFADASLDHPDAPQLAYATGNALFRKRDWDGAAKAYEKALRGADAPLATKALYNAGNAFFRKGEAAVSAGDQGAIDSYREAMARYKKALEITPSHKDSKRNIEVTQARIKELLKRQEQQQKQQPQNQQQKPPPEPSEEAKAAFARAMHLVAERRYTEAKAVLSDIVGRDPTAASYQAHLRRLDDVINIMEGKPVQQPAPADPRSNQSGMGVI